MSTCRKGKMTTEEKNWNLERIVQELQHRLDETTERRKPVLTDFTTLANELQRMLRFEVFSTVTSDSDKSNVLTEGQSVSDDVCSEVVMNHKICIIKYAGFINTL